MQKQVVPDTSRDEKILAKLGRSMSPGAYMEACSIAYVCGAQESVIVTALERLYLEGRVEKRVVTGVKRRVDWRARV
jgi:hypothetical protein